jgi:dihydrodipicolinate reductase
MAREKVFFGNFSEFVWIYFALYSRKTFIEGRIRKIKGIYE